MVAEEGETPVRGLSDEEIRTYDELNRLMRRAGWRELDQAQQELTIRSDYALYAAIAQLENANDDLRGTPIATMLETILQSNQAHYELEHYVRELLQNAWDSVDEDQNAPLHWRIRFTRNGELTFEHDGKVFNGRPQNARNYGEGVALVTTRGTTKSRNFSKTGQFGLGFKGFLKFFGSVDISCTDPLINHVTHLHWDVSSDQDRTHIYRFERNPTDDANGERLTTFIFKQARREGDPLTLSRENLLSQIKSQSLGKKENLTMSVTHPQGTCVISISTEAPHEEDDETLIRRNIRIPELEEEFTRFVISTPAFSEDESPPLTAAATELIERLREPLRQDQRNAVPDPEVWLRDQSSKLILRVDPADRANAGRWISNHAFIDQTTQGEDDDFDDEVIWRVDAPFFLDETRRSLLPTAGQANAHLLRRTIAHGLPPAAKSLRASPMLAGLYRTPDIQSNAFFNQAFSVTDPETNLAAHVELQDIFGLDSELFFNAAGEPIPTSLVRKIPRDWTVLDADGNEVWVAEAIRNTADNAASLRDALPNVPFVQVEGHMAKPVESENTFLHFAPAIEPQELFSSLEASNLTDQIIRDFQNIINKPWFVPVPSSVSTLILHSPVEPVTPGSVESAFQTLWGVVGDDLQEFSNSMVVTDPQSLVWRKYQPTINDSARQREGHKGRNQSITLHYVNERQGLGDVITRLLDIISSNASNNMPACLEGLAGWVQAFVDAAALDQQNTLGYRPVRLTVHTTGAGEASFVALFPIQGLNAQGEQVMVCQRTGRVWQRKAPNNYAHDAWSAGRHRIIVQPTLSDLLISDGAENNAETTEAQLEGAIVNHHVLMALGESVEHPIRVRKLRDLVDEINQNLVAADDEGEQDGEQAHPFSAQLLLIEANPLGNVGHEHLRFLAREPTLKNTEVRSLSEFKRNQLGLPNAIALTRSRLVNRDLNFHDEKKFVDPNNEMSVTNLNHAILSFCPLSTHFWNDENGDAKTLLALETISPQPARYSGLIYLPMHDGNWSWSKTMHQSADSDALNHAPHIEAIRSVATFVHGFGAVATPTGLELEDEDTLVFLSSEDFCGPQFDRDHTPDALRFFARGIIAFFSSRSWNELEPLSRAHVLQTTLERTILGHESQIAARLDEMFKLQPPGELEGFVMKQRTEELIETIDENHPSMPLLKAILRIDDQDDDNLTHRVIQNNEPWSEYNQIGRPLGEVFRWQDGIASPVQRPRFDANRPLISVSDALWLFPSLKDQGGLCWGLVDDGEICIVRNDLYAALSNDANGNAITFDQVEKEWLWEHEIDELILEQVEGNEDPWIFARILLAIVSQERTETFIESSQLPAIETVDPAQESYLKFTDDSILTVGRHGWGLSMREEDGIQLWVLTTAMQGPTLQSLDALRHFLIRTIPGLTGSKLDSLNLETASWEDISSQDQFIEGIMLAHQEQAGLFNPFSQQGRERWYEQFMDPETSLHEEISNLVESPDTLPHRFNVLQDAVKALKTDHAYLDAQQDISRKFITAQTLYNAHHSMLLEEPRMLYSQNDEGKTHVRALFRYAKSDNPTHPTYGNHLQESMGNTVFFSPATANRFSMTADPAGLRWADGVIFAKAGPADAQQGTLFGNMLRDVQEGHCPGDLYILQDVLRIGDQPYSLLIHPVHLLHIAAQAAARDDANIEEEPAEGPDE